MFLTESYRMSGFKYVNPLECHKDSIESEKSLIFNKRRDKLCLFRQQCLKLVEITVFQTILGSSSATQKSFG